MITKFKIFEDNKNGINYWSEQWKLKIGLYILVNIDKEFLSFNEKDSADILNNNICQITRIEDVKYSIEIKCEIIDITWWVRLAEISEISDNKDDLQTILDSRKFNI